MNDKWKHRFKYIFNKKYRFMSMKRLHCGRLHPNKTFYVIRSNAEKWGLMTTCMYFMQATNYALKQEYIPVIDLKNNYMHNLQLKEKAHKDNAWEYYFKTEYSLDEVYKSKNVIVGYGSGWTPGEDWARKDYPMEPDTLIEWNQLFTQYLVLQDDIEEKVRKAYDDLFTPERGRVLGIAIRGGYVYLYKSNASYIAGHPIQPSISEYISLVEEKMKSWNCDSLFVISDDIESLEIVKKRFGEKCFYYNRPRKQYFKNGIAVPQEELTERWKNVVESTNKEYIVGIHLLSKCDCFFSSKSSSAKMSYILNGGKFTHVEIFDEGNYK